MLFSIRISQILHRIYMYQNYSSIVINNYFISKLLYAYKIPFNCIFTILSCSFIVNPLLNNLKKMRVALLGATLMQEHGKWWASFVAQMAKNPPTLQETWVWSLGWEDPLEEGMSIHSSILIWRNPMDRGAWPDTVNGVTNRHDWVTKHSTLYMAYLYNSFFWKDIWLA